MSLPIARFVRRVLSTINRPDFGPCQECGATMRALDTCDGCLQRAGIERSAAADQANESAAASQPAAPHAALNPVPILTSARAGAARS
jgi:hypothetical protein